MLTLRLARRDMRGGIRGLWIVLLCLALGVAVIAAVGSLRAATDQGLATDGRRILGGDLEVESGAQELPPALRDWLGARDARLSEVVQMRSMLVAPSGERQLVELKAVDSAWPLVGEAGIDPPSCRTSPSPPCSPTTASSPNGLSLTASTFTWETRFAWATPPSPSAACSCPSPTVWPPRSSLVHAC